MTKRIYSVPDLREYLDSVDAYAANIFPCGYYDEMTSEDPIMGIDGREEIMNWILENPSYIEWGEMIGYMIVVSNSKYEYVGTVIY